MLNPVRHLLALLVIVAHPLPIDRADWPTWMGKREAWAVAGFFVISGYLATGSRLNAQAASLTGT